MSAQEGDRRAPVHGRGSGRRASLGRAGRRTLEMSTRAPTWRAVAVVAAFLAASWGLSWAVGGAGRVVPHWYYFPVLLAALRFGHPGALLVALASGVLAGPLTPELVGAGVAQRPSEWLTRTAFFVAVGQVAALLAGPARPSLAAEVRRLRTEHATRRALARDELEVWFQPVCAVADGRVVGAEALVRWRDPQQGLLPAAAFMPEVEQSAAIHDLGAWVLRRACAHAAQWPGDVWVAVNVSAAELDDPGLCQRLAAAIHDAGLAPQRVCVEVTETTLVADVEESVERLAALRATGVQIAIDDFGTGYSSLAYVNRFPADVLKIDRSFVTGLVPDGRHGAVAGGIVMLAGTLGMRTIAEGVETPHQSQRLNELGCGLAQGFHYHHPMAADELAMLLGHQERAGTSDRAQQAAELGGSPREPADARSRPQQPARAGGRRQARRRSFSVVGPARGGTP